MLGLNPFLQSLLEATEQETVEKNKKKGNDEEKPKMSDVTKEGADDFPDPPEEPKDDTAENEQEGDTTDEEKGSETDDAKGTEEGSETEAGEEGSQDGEESNDFSLDSDQENEGEDSDPPPDGLTDPDDDGSNDEPEEGEETNLHINILNISKVERALAKKRCLQDFMDLRSTVDSLNNVVMSHEATIEPDVRTEVIKDLNDMYTKLSDYLKYKFSYTNYEENLQNYLIFVHSVNSIVRKLQEKGISGK